MHNAQGSIEVSELSRRGDPTGHIRLSVAERRVYRRGVISAQINLKIQNENYPGELVDISAGGAQLRCSVVLRIGAEIEVEINQDGVFPARVIRRHPKTIAVEFIFPESRREKLVEKLNQLIQAYI